MEEDFYATVKFKSGEEVFAKVAASEEEDRTMLIIHNPIIVAEIKGRNGLMGYKVEPWLKTTRDDMFIVNLADILTLSESEDVEMICMHQNFVRDTLNEQKGQKLSRRMGYLGNVNDTKEILEKLYNKDIKDTKS